MIIEDSHIRKLKAINFDNVTWSPFYIVIIRLVDNLYGIDDCSGTGGLAHVVIDDDNVDTGSISRCLNLCDENPDKVECELVRCIMMYLLKLNEDQRKYLFFVWDMVGSPDVEYSFEYKVNFDIDLDYYMTEQNEYGGYKSEELKC